MGDAADATRGADEIFGPADTGTYAGTTTASTTSAANLDLGNIQGGRFVSFQARGGDVYVRFKAAAGSAGTTSGAGSNGLKIPQDTRVDFWVTLNERFVDHICSASGDLFWWQSSPNYRIRA